MAAMNSTNPNAATGKLVTPRSSTQRITNGNRLSQNSRPRFAHRTRPSTRLAVCIM